MSQLDQQVARRLTRFYMIALAALAVLSLSGLVLIKQTISNHYDDSRVVNVAGRQRMLSQRLTKLALMHTTGLTTVDTASFDSLLRSWGQTHIQLRNGTLTMEKAYNVRKSARLDSMFVQIEPYFQSMHQAFERIGKPQQTAIERQKALRIILRDELPFLQQMNDIVFQFDTESFERVKTLERIEWLLTGATLLVLLIEGLFIFRPVVSHTRHVIHKLTRSEKTLQTTNNQLAIANHELGATNLNLATSNRKLVDTQAELLRTTEEKYELQRTEDTVRSAALLEGQEEERRRFARELHDGIGQMLTGLKLHAEKLKSVTLPDEKQRARFAELCDLIYETIQTTRQISYNLMPSTLSDFGLDATLQLLAEQTARSSGIQIIFEGNQPPRRYVPAMEIGLYRIAQEALNNAIKYARAQTIRITLQQKNQRLILSVADNGKGFSVQGLSDNNRPLSVISGLDNMRTRARLLSGELTITSKPKKGTTVQVIVNLSASLT